MFSWSLGTLLAMENCDSVKLLVIMDNTCMMGSCYVILEDEYIPMPMGIGHNNRLNDIVPVVKISDIFLVDSLVDLEFCPLSHGDPSPNYDFHLHSGDLQSWLEAGNTPQGNAKPFAAHFKNLDRLNFMS